MEIKELAQKIKSMKPEDRKKLADELEKGEPTIFERFPVGSYICGLEVTRHDENSKIYPIELSRNGLSCWVGTDLLQPITACHDWVERYTPFLESARKSFFNLGQYPLSDLGKCAEKVGLWDCQTPVKKPWEESHE